MFESVILGLIQGLTEFLPISSSGHLIIAREFLGLSLENSLSFDIFLNTATLFAVVYCFWGNLKRIFIDFKTEGFSARSKKIIISIIVATIPAAFIGYKYGDQIEQTFRSSGSVAWALLVGSVLMLFADIINKKSDKHTTGAEPIKAFFIGLFQALAFIPGMSRSGSTISGGLLFKLSREEAIRFSFLLYIPISIGAALKAFLDADMTNSFIPQSFNEVGAFFTALISGIWAVKFMIRYLSKNSFTPFIIYRILLAIVILALL